MSGASGRNFAAAGRCAGRRERPRSPSAGVTDGGVLPSRGRRADPGTARWWGSSPALDTGRRPGHLLPLHRAVGRPCGRPRARRPIRPGAAASSVRDVGRFGASVPGGLCAATLSPGTCLYFAIRAKWTSNVVRIRPTRNRRGRMDDSAGGRGASVRLGCGCPATDFGRSARQGSSLRAVARRPGARAAGAGAGPMRRAGYTSAGTRGRVHEAEYMRPSTRGRVHKAEYTRPGTQGEAHTARCIEPGGDGVKCARADWHSGHWHNG